MNDRLHFFAPTQAEPWPARTGFGIRCPSANDEQCRHPECVCHRPDQRFREHDGDDARDEDGHAPARWRWLLLVALGLVAACAAAALLTTR